MFGTLTPREWEELCVWLDQYQHPIDTRIQSDLASGRLDKAIQRALSDGDERSTRRIHRAAQPARDVAPW